MSYDSNGNKVASRYRMGIFDWLVILAVAEVAFFASCSPALAVPVNTAQTSSDGSYAVRLVRSGTRSDLACEPTAGPSYWLTAMAENRNVLFFEIAPTSRRVVYIADAGTVDQKFELYSVPIAGGSATRLNASLVNNDYDVDTFRISPDGARVVYHPGQVSSGRWELYSVPLAGGDAVRINRPMGVGGAVDRYFYITSDSALVVYRADAERNGEHNVYAVPLLGGVSRLLSLPLAPGGDVREMDLLPGDLVRYEADLMGGGSFRWYVVPAHGGVTLAEIFRDGFESGGVTKWQ